MKTMSSLCLRKPRFEGEPPTHSFGQRYPQPAHALPRVPADHGVMLGSLPGWRFNNGSLHKDTTFGRLKCISEQNLPTSVYTLLGTKH